MVVFVTCSIDIAAPPTVVRAKFFDWPSIPTYHPYGFFRSLTPLPVARSPAPPAPIDLRPGDKIHQVMDFMDTKSATVACNTPDKFSWAGGVPGLFLGEHMWHFRPGPNGGTTLVHEERFSGVASFVLGEGWLAGWIGMTEKTKKGFGTWNEDFKKWVESGR